jgi:hypothetical protein
VVSHATEHNGKASRTGAVKCIAAAIKKSLYDEGSRGGVLYDKTTRSYILRSANLTDRVSVDMVH